MKTIKVENNQFNKDMYLTYGVAVAAEYHGISQSHFKYYVQNYNWTPPARKETTKNIQSVVVEMLKEKQAL